MSNPLPIPPAICAAAVRTLLTPPSLTPSGIYSDHITTALGSLRQTVPSLRHARDNLTLSNLLSAQRIYGDPLYYYNSTVSLSSISEDIRSYHSLTYLQSRAQDMHDAYLSRIFPILATYEAKLQTSFSNILQLHPQATISARQIHIPSFLTITSISDAHIPDRTVPLSEPHTYHLTINFRSASRLFSIISDPRRTRLQPFTTLAAHLATHSTIAANYTAAETLSKHVGWQNEIFRVTCSTPSLPHIPLTQPCHPHVSAGQRPPFYRAPSLCLGNASTQITHHFYNFRFHLVLDLIRSVLSAYSHESPFTLPSRIATFGTPVAFNSPPPSVYLDNPDDSDSEDEDEDDYTCPTCPNCECDVYDSRHHSLTRRNATPLGSFCSECGFICEHCEEPTVLDEEVEAYTISHSTQTRRGPNTRICSACCDTCANCHYSFISDPDNIRYRDQTDSYLCTECFNNLPDPDSDDDNSDSEPEPESETEDDPIISETVANSLLTELTNPDPTPTQLTQREPDILDRLAEVFDPLPEFNSVLTADSSLVPQNELNQMVTRANQNTVNFLRNYGSRERPDFDTYTNPRYESFHEGPIDPAMLARMTQLIPPPLRTLEETTPDVTQQTPQASTSPLPASPPPANLADETSAIMRSFPI